VHEFSASNCELYRSIIRIKLQEYSDSMNHSTSSSSSSSAGFSTTVHYLEYVASNGRIIDELERIWKKVVAP
jgi:hypothetical protein